MGVSAISGSLLGGKIYQIAGGEKMYFVWALLSLTAGLIYSFYLLKKEKEIKINAA